MINLTKVLLSSLFVVMLVAGVFAISTDPVFSSSDESSDVAEITDDISAADIVESEDEVESERSNYVKRTVSSGSGWIITGQKGALLDIHLVSGYTDNKTATSKGWIKAGKLKLKLESTQSTDTKKTFDVSAGDGSVSGTLVLNRGSTYQTGFAVWTGDLDLTVGNESFDASVNLAMEERAIGEGKIKEQNDRSHVTATGGLELAGLNLNLEGKSKVTMDRMEFKITGDNNAEGELVLERVSSTADGIIEYIGKIKIETSDNAGDRDNKIAGKVTATLTSEGSTLYGPIKYSGEDGASESGNIKIAFSRQVDSSRDSGSSDDSDARKNDRKEDRSGSNSGSDNSGSNRGFWKRFIDFFGA